MVMGSPAYVGLGAITVRVAFSLVTELPPLLTTTLYIAEISLRSVAPTE